MELIVSIIFANKECFKNLNKQQCQTICQTFKSDIYHDNENIKKYKNKYIAEYFYEVLLENMLSMTMVCDKTEYLFVEAALLSDIQKTSEEAQDYFKLLLITEYKERLFMSFYQNNENNLISEHERVIDILCAEYDLHKHRHEPQHFMWHDMQVPYKFYDWYERLNMRLL